MRTLLQHDVFNAWEAGLGRPVAERALHLLHEAHEFDAERLTIGARDALLVELRKGLFGATLTACVNCPACGQEQEFDLPAGGFTSCASAHAEPLWVSFKGVQIHFRLPDSTDLLAISDVPTVEDGRLALLKRCVIEPVPVELPEGAVEAISAAMAEADPVGNPEIKLNCAACGRPWSEAFDIASFLLAEIHAWASRTLREIHQLAAAYGWSENECLSVSPWRRSRYLELLAE